MPYVVTPNYLQRRNDRKMSILPPIKIGHLYGLADDEDNIQVKGIWESIGKFSDGVAFAKNVDGLYGMIDHFGNLVLKYQWMQIDEFHKGVARVKSPYGLWGFVGKSGAIVTLHVNGKRPLSSQMVWLMLLLMRKVDTSKRMVNWQ